MEFHESSVTPKDAEMLSSRLFTRAEVASVFGVPAELLDAADDARGDRKEARTQFYADCLPPILGPVADDLDLQVLETEYGADDHYFEFNLNEKLRGTPEERYKVLVSAGGGPFMTRNEVRKRENLPELPEAEELITPLNVTQGGKPSPVDMPVQDANEPSQDGDERTDARMIQKEWQLREAAQAELLARRDAQARRRDRYAEEHRELLGKHFTTQEKSYKATKKFDLERWNAELADDLEEKALATVEREGGIAAERLGQAGGFDLEACRNYLRRGAEEKAQAINQTTANRIEEAGGEIKGATESDIDVLGLGGLVADDDDDEPNPFGDKDKRAEEGGLAIATSLASFSHLEAAKQTPDAPQRVKTWIVTSGNSRHPQMSGETVPVFTPFSNGGEYPGDPKLGIDEVARCQCLIEVA
jgi:hypothetical protein